MVYIITWKRVFTQGEDKCLFQEKPVVIGPLKIPTSLKDHIYKPDISNTVDSLATISRVNIDILPTERRNSMNDGLVQENPPGHLDASNELISIHVSLGSQIYEQLVHFAIDKACNHKYSLLRLDCTRLLFILNILVSK